MSKFRKAVLIYSFPPEFRVKSEQEGIRKMKEIKEVLPPILDQIIFTIFYMLFILFVGWVAM